MNDHKTCFTCGARLIAAKKSEGGNCTAKQLRGSVGYCWPCLRAVNAEKKRLEAGVAALRAGAKAMAINGYRKVLEAAYEHGEKPSFSDLDLELEMMRNMPMDGEIPDEYLNDWPHHRPTHESHRARLTTRRATQKDEA